MSINQIKQFKEFATGNKVRDLLIKEMTPVMQKLESQWKRIRTEMDQFKDKYQMVLKFQSQKLQLQKNIKAVQKQSYQNRNLLMTLKTDSDLNQTKNSTKYTNLQQQVASFQTNMIRRDQNLLNYDRKINGIMDAASKSQAYINQRIIIFEDKYKKLAKDTLQMTRDVKRDFDNSVTNNQIMQSQLLHKLKHISQQQSILQLYLTQREDIANKIINLTQQTKNNVKHSQFQDFKHNQQIQLQSFFSNIKSLLEEFMPKETQYNLKIMNIKFAEIQDLKIKTNKIQQLKRQIQKISESLRAVQSVNDEKIVEQIRVETEQIQQKMIQVIDKKIQTIESNIENINIQAQQNIEDKIKLIKDQLNEMLKIKFEEHIQLMDQNKPVIVLTQDKQDKNLISIQLQKAQEQRQKLQDYCNNIQSIAVGLNQKLTLFSHRVTVCRSDIQLFTENTKRQIKKITQQQRQQQFHMQKIGKMLAQYIQALMILTSLALQQETNKSKNTFVTYQDGIIFQFDKNIKQNQIIYRRNVFGRKELKQSLLFSLVTLVDNTILDSSILKWNINKPSQFFKQIKSNFEQRERAASRSPSLLIYSSRKMIKRVGQQQGTIQNFRGDSVQLERFHQLNKKSDITITNPNVPWPFDNPKSQMQKRYKIKRNQERSRKEIEERNCMTASKSNRKTKMNNI